MKNILALFAITILMINVLPVFAPSHPEYVGFAPPLQQIKAGVALVDIQCNEGKYIVYKSNRMAAACVTADTESELIKRGWALLRLAMYDVPAEIALCEYYGGNWLDSHNECEYVSPLQCSLMGGLR